jgi:predicted phosphodiesterase
LNRQWKGKVVRKIAKDSADIDALIQDIVKHKPRKPTATMVGAWLVVVVADWQVGKRDGDGLKGLVERWMTAIDSVDARWKELQKLKRPLQGILVLCVGDLVEGCGDHYAMQTFSVELDRRDQVKVARRLLRDALIRWSKYAPEIQVAAVAGNHGENRKGGKAFTTFNDNDDVALVEQVAEIFSANPEAFGHIKFAIPRDQLTLTVEVAGKIIGITHGHLAGGGSTAENKLRQWLANQALGKQSIADCDILVTGHYHHFRAADWGGILWFQAPTLDGGSFWWQQLSGQHSQAGVLTFVVSELGASDLQIL